MKLVAKVPIPYADAGLPGSGVVLRGEAFSAGTAAKGKRLVRLGFARHDGNAHPSPEPEPLNWRVKPEGGGWYSVVAGDSDNVCRVAKSIQGKTAVLDFLGRSGATATLPDGSPFE